MITIINYGSGNIAALANIYNQIGVPFSIASKPSELLPASKLILPGVGAFDPTMKLLNDSGITEVLNELVVVNKIPILGICVGMHIMANGSEEGHIEGLGWIDAHVKRFDKSIFTTAPHLPHMGWNSAEPSRQNLLFNNIDHQKGFYFLHSYYIDCKRAENILAETFYGIHYASAVTEGHIFGVQFHPEKSHSNGIQILTNFAEI